MNDAHVALFYKSETKLTHRLINENDYIYSEPHNTYMYKPLSNSWLRYSDWKRTWSFLKEEHVPTDMRAMLLLIKWLEIYALQSLYILFKRWST